MQPLKDAGLRNTCLASTACMFIGAGGGEEEVEVGFVLFIVWIADGVDVDVVVTTRVVITVVGLQ